jgi:hypothetical protein
MNPFSTCLMNFYRSMTFTWHLNLICGIKYFTGILYWTYVIEDLLLVFPEIVSMGANPRSLCCVYNFWINLTTFFSLRDKKKYHNGSHHRVLFQIWKWWPVKQSVFFKRTVHSCTVGRVCGGGGSLIANSLCAGGSHKPICQGPYSSLFYCSLLHRLVKRSFRE